MWVPAHRTAEDYAARGIPERHRLGNAAADAAASEVAALRAPPGAWRAHRAAQLADAEACQRILAAVELAVLRADHRPTAHRGPRVKRRWAGVKRGVG
eukprot:331975-Lingulodinium_polyedra.AAC.1